MIDIDDYVDHETWRMCPQDLTGRIEQLRVICDADEAEGGLPPADATDELAELVGFRDAVTAKFGWFTEDMVTLVPDRYFERYVRYVAEREHGIGPDNIGDYVDWPAYAKQRRGWFTQLELDGETIWAERV